MSKELVFQSVESLQQVVNVINERLWQLLMIKHVQYERVQSQKC